ncbi:MAG: class II aldolase/adducin family protein [Thermoanaerobaculia bacterium]
MREEGVIKFELEHERRPLARERYGEPVCSLIAWREILALTGLVGQDRARYEGAGYGNVSIRIGRPGMGLGRRSFLVTGTQTSGKHCIGLDDFCAVERYDFDRNRIVSHGLTPPSSESMTHGAVYDLGPHIRCVLHAHTPVLWNRRHELRLPETSASVPYGTPEMAREVQRLYREGVFAERRVLAMGGHEDGIIAFGKSPEHAGQALLTWLARAYERDCEPGAELCLR